MENDESETTSAAPGPHTPPPGLLVPGEPAPKLLHGGQSPTWRAARGVLRAATTGVIQAQIAGSRRLREVFPELADQAPRPLQPPLEHQGLTWLLEEDLGAPCDEPLERVEGWGASFLAARAEPVPLQGTVRELLRRVAPWSLSGPARLVGALREAREAGAALPFAPRLATVQRALDQPLEAELTRSWGHGALSLGRVLARGACHWRHFGPDHWAGMDRVPFVDPDPADPAAALLALAWGWRWDPERAAEALVALGLVESTPPRLVTLRLATPHPCLGPADLERLLGVPLGEVTASAGARALGRGQGLVVAGEPLRLEVDPEVRPRRSSAAWRIRDRDPTRLFSRWHDGIRLDPDTRASLTPEATALATAQRMGASTVVDAFCGAGGNAIGFARMPWCRQVIAVELDPQRLAMARHNAALYGVQEKIRFVQGDFFELGPALLASAQACFLDPPWAAGPELAERAWHLARAHAPRGAMKQPRQWPAPAGASALEAVFGVGSIISWVQAWWDEGETRRRS